MSKVRRRARSLPGHRTNRRLRSRALHNLRCGSSVTPRQYEACSGHHSIPDILDRRLRSAMFGGSGTHPSTGSFNGPPLDIRCSWCWTMNHSTSTYCCNSCCRKQLVLPRDDQRQPPLPQLGSPTPAVHQQHIPMPVQQVPQQSISGSNFGLIAAGHMSPGSSAPSSPSAPVSPFPRRHDDEDHWRCGTCCMVNQCTTSVCLGCNRPRVRFSQGCSGGAAAPSSPSQIWQCMNCGSSCSISTSYCGQCGASRHGGRNSRSPSPQGGHARGTQSGGTSQLYGLLSTRRARSNSPRRGGKPEYGQCHRLFFKGYCEDESCPWEPCASSGPTIRVQHDARIPANSVANGKQQPPSPFNVQLGAPSSYQGNGPVPINQFPTAFRVAGPKLQPIQEVRQEIHQPHFAVGFSGAPHREDTLHDKRLAASNTLKFIGATSDEICRIDKRVILLPGQECQCVAQDATAATWVVTDKAGNIFSRVVLNNVTPAEYDAIAVPMRGDAGGVLSPEHCKACTTSVMRANRVGKDDLDNVVEVLSDIGVKVADPSQQDFEARVSCQQYFDYATKVLDQLDLVSACVDSLRSRMLTNVARSHDKLQQLVEHERMQTRACSGTVDVHDTDAQIAETALAYIMSLDLDDPEEQRVLARTISILKSQSSPKDINMKVTSATKAASDISSISDMSRACLVTAARAHEQNSGTSADTLSAAVISHDADAQHAQALRAAFDSLPQRKSERQRSRSPLDKASIEVQESQEVDLELVKISKVDDEESSPREQSDVIVEVAAKRSKTAPRIMSKGPDPQLRKLSFSQEMLELAIRGIKRNGQMRKRALDLMHRERWLELEQLLVELGILSLPSS